jgi:hypothetical protein
LMRRSQRGRKTSTQQERSLAKSSRSAHKYHARQQKSSCFSRVSRGYIQNKRIYVFEVVFEVVLKFVLSVPEYILTLKIDSTASVLP